MKITKKYLKIPVGIDAEKVSICFNENGTLVFDLFVHYKKDASDFMFYQPTEPVFGKDIVFTVSGEVIELLQTDERDDSGIGSETLRPYVHFTAKRGWINDPNGLLFDGEKYHMFFQHNPVGVLWGNMHWGHAVSNDLIHWEELDIALFPDKFGTMYSGSAVLDSKNISGLSKNGENVICLFYTSCGDASNGGNSLLSKGRESLQHLAYSNDGGKTFKKYEGNPIVDEVTKENRDPKVIYAEELGCYIMALYLECNDYLLLTSKNLIHWEKRQRIAIQGESECPDIYPLEPENEKDGRLWVLTGASDRYLVGRLYSEGDIFRPLQEEKSYEIDKFGYAAQTFSGIENRRIKTAWGTAPAPNCIFNNMMTLFTEVSLVKLGDEYFVRTLPIREYDDFSEVTESSVGDVSRGLDSGAYDITVNAGNSPFEFNVCGRSFMADPKKNILFDGERELPLRYSDEEIKIRIVIDTLGFELFIDNGLIYVGYKQVTPPFIAVKGGENISTVVKKFKPITRK